jgi:type I restriction enzyme, S subunit
VKHVPIGAVIESIQTWTPASEPDRDITYLDLSSIDNQAKTIVGPARLLGRDAPSRARQLVRSGDVLVSTVRPNLNAVAVVGPGLDGATASTGFTVLRPKPNLDARYLFHWLRGTAFISEMVRRATGASYPAVSDRIVKQSAIPLPELSEQHRIAAILDCVDTLGAKHQRVIRALGEAEQAAFTEAFVEAETEELGNKLRFVTSGGRGWAKYYADDGSPFIRSLDVQMGKVASEDLASVAAPDNAEARRTRTERGDVLLTITGSRIGRASALPQTLCGAYVSQHVAILRPDTQQILPGFLSAFLCARSFGQVQIRAAQYGQTKPGLNFEQIRRFRIPKADIKRQKEFCATVATIRGLAAKAARADLEFEELFASLHSRAFSGQL